MARRSHYGRSSGHRDPYSAQVMFKVYPEGLHFGVPPQPLPGAYGAFDAEVAATAAQKVLTAAGKIAPALFESRAAQRVAESEAELEAIRQQTAQYELEAAEAEARAGTLAGRLGVSQTTLWVGLAAAGAVTLALALAALRRR